MKLLVDASAILAVITNEASKSRIIHATGGAEILAPESIHWEIGYAFSAMFTRKVITLDQATAALKIYQELPIRFVTVSLDRALKMAHTYNIYAYDAYLIVGSLEYQSELLTLDRRLSEIAELAGAKVVRI